MCAVTISVSSYVYLSCGIWNGLHLVDYWSKGFHTPPQISQIIAKGFSYSPSPDDQTPLLKTKLTYVINHEEMKLVAIQMHHVY